MDKQRSSMINGLLSLVDNWPSKDLIAYVKSNLYYYYDTLSFEDLEEEYTEFCCKEEYPETFPEGYKEP